MWQLTKRYQKLGERFFSYVVPDGLKNTPQLIHLNRELIDQLGLDGINDEQWREILSGNQVLDDYQPLASVYMGHQFGVHVPKLGDGRAMLIAEHCDPHGTIWELQLKGAGKTPYSRMGDGRAVLRSSIREYLVSHFMKSLGVPTTLALGLIVADDLVNREKPEKAAIVMRAATSFLRFGNFEYFAHQHKVTELQQLINFTVINYFPSIDIKTENYIFDFFQEVVRLTAKTIAQWQCFGFVHGVMNTDNMSILGLTIDYGPYAFIDGFAPKHIYNHSDGEGRYVYANQPHIAWWNLYRLAEALLALPHITEEALQPILDSFAEYYNHEYLTLMWQKLGIMNLSDLTDKHLLEELLKELESHNVDWTFFWYQLSNGESGVRQIQDNYPSLNMSLFYERILKIHSEDYIEPDLRQQIMRKVSPAFVLRNDFLHDAISKAEAGNFSEVELLFKLASEPFQQIRDNEYYYQLPPAWSQNIELSCSS